MSKKNFCGYFLAAFTIALIVVGCSKDTTGPDNEHKKIGWVVADPDDGYGTILYTDDGGQNWIRQGDTLSIPNTSLSAVKAVDSLHAWIVGPAIDGYGIILKTSDGGSTWQRLQNRGGIPNEEFLGLYACSQTEVWVVGANNTIIYTNDGGETWTSKADTSFLPFNLCSIAIVNDKIWVCGNKDPLGGTIIYSPDYGDTWYDQSYGEFFDNHGMIEISAASDSCLWAVGHGRTILHTSDGCNWEVQKTDVDIAWDANGVCAISEDIAWVVEDVGQIFYTTNSGVIWYKQNVPGAATGILLYRISPLNSREAWVVGPYGGKNMDLGIILHTSNGGQIWTMQDYEPNVALWDVSFVDAHH